MILPSRLRRSMRVDDPRQHHARARLRGLELRALVGGEEVAEGGEVLLVAKPLHRDREERVEQADRGVDVGPRVARYVGDELPREVARAIDHAAEELAPLPPPVERRVGPEHQEQAERHADHRVGDRGRVELVMLVEVRGGAAEGPGDEHARDDPRPDRAAQPNHHSEPGFCVVVDHGFPGDPEEPGHDTRLAAKWALALPIWATP